MEIARKTEFMPHVRAELSWLGPMFIILKITNYGKGPATNIRAKIMFLPSKTEREWNEAVLSPNETIRILLPEGNINKVCEEAARIHVKGEYQDVFGQEYEIDEMMDSKEFIDQGKQLQGLIESDAVSEIKGVHEELRKAVSELSRTRYDLEGISKGITSLNQTVERILYIYKKEKRDDS